MMKLRRKIVGAIVLAAFCSCFFCSAQDETGGKKADKKKVIRDPFWPVDWKPPEEQPAVAAPGAPRVVKPVKTPEQKWKEALAELKVTGIVEQPATGKYMAIVSGFGIVEEGDIIWVNRGGLTYKWKVETITAKGLVPRKLDALPSK